MHIMKIKEEFLLASALQSITDIDSCASHDFFWNFHEKTKPRMRSFLAFEQRLES